MFPHLSHVSLGDQLDEDQRTFLCPCFDDSMKPVAINGVLRSLGICEVVDGFRVGNQLSNLTALDVWQGEDSGSLSLFRKLFVEYGETFIATVNPFE